MTASGTRYLVAPKNSVYMLTSSVSAIPYATGRPDKLKNSYCTCSKFLLPFQYSSATTNVINLYPYSVVLCVESTHTSEPKSLNKSA